jgi:hypothetical protein
MPNQYTSPPIEERFWQKVDRSGGPDTCWFWIAGKDADGYGIFYARSSSKRAHHFAYELHIGPVPDGLQVLHSCDTPPCCNPGHLFLGTSADNMADMRAKGREWFPGPNNPARGERNGMYTHPEARMPGEKNAAAKLTWTQVRAIRAAHAATGQTGASLAREYGVSKTQLCEILRNQSWREEDYFVSSGFSSSPD